MIHSSIVSPEQVIYKISLNNFSRGMFKNMVKKYPIILCITSNNTDNEEYKQTLKLQKCFQDNYEEDNPWRNYIGFDYDTCLSSKYFLFESTDEAILFKLLYV